MTLKSWLENHWVEAHKSSPDEIASLLSIVDRDLKDAAVSGLSSDAKGNLAYNAMLQLAILSMHAEGYRPGRVRPHERAVASLEHTMGAARETIDFLDLARRKRHSAQYGHAGGTTAKEASEMLKVATGLRTAVVAWLRRKHNLEF
jgi:hypothetical protein